MFWSTSYNYHRTLNEISSIWLVFTSTLECIEPLESSNKPFIIERIHFHRKLFRSFFSTFLLTHILVVSFIFFVSAGTTLKHTWYLECCKRYGRIPMNTLNWWRRPRQKKNQQQPLISYLKCDAKHLFVHLMIWMTESSHFSDFHTIFDKFAARKIIITIPFCRVLFRLHP